jgi:hypothetical protein
MSQDDAFEHDLDREVNERLALMEEPGYEYPETLNKLDWTLIAVIPIVSVALLVIGEFL